MRRKNYAYANILVILLQLINATIAVSLFFFLKKGYSSFVNLNNMESAHTESPRRVILGSL